MLLRTPSPGSSQEEYHEVVTEEDTEQSTQEDHKILCRQCGNIITSNQERIAVQGAHEHTFSNPAGILFQIGCFRSASGCIHMSLPTDEFSWFKGFSWCVAACSMCNTHLGWLFVSSGGMSFYGLIIDRLVQS